MHNVAYNNIYINIININLQVLIFNLAINITIIYYLQHIRQTCGTLRRLYRHTKIKWTRFETKISVCL